VEVNAAEEEHIAFNADTTNHNDSDADSDSEMYNDTEYHNYDHVPSSTKIDLCLIYYEWLADSGATSHITHRHNTFNTYEPIPPVPISGVGGTKVHAIRWGNVKVKSKCNNRTYILKLKNVLHVPKNKNNLLFLGKWEREGHSYNACDGTLSLLMKDKKPVARGAKISNDLYKMTFKHVP